MPSIRKIEANRLNARCSTGPKSSAGRNRSARNSRRHGLSTSLYADTSTAAAVETLVHRIVGVKGNDNLIALARRLAEAEIDLQRVSRVRHELLVQSFATSSNERHTRAQSANPKDLRDRTNLERSELSVSKAGKFVESLAKETEELAALERYERRALSRRKFAVREFNAARGKDLR